MARPQSDNGAGAAKWARTVLKTGPEGTSSARLAFQKNLARTLCLRLEKFGHETAIGAGPLLNLREFKFEAGVASRRPRPLA